MIKVLLLEDDYDFAALLQAMLQVSHPGLFDIKHVDRLTQALVELECSPYDVALIDLYLPDSRGFDTFYRIFTQSPRLPVVVLTVLDDESLAFQTVREGAQDYLIKGGIDGHFLARSVRYAIERQQTLSKLQQLSLLDELTGLLNRRGFWSIAEQHIKIARRSQRQLMLFFADLDQLKKINDHFGHPEGDQALRSFSQMLKATFRSSDVFGRIGGDEFSVLAIDFKYGAERILERLKANLDQRNAANPSYILSVSVGSALFEPSSSDTLEDLLARADKDLYAHKRAKQIN